MGLNLVFLSSLSKLQIRTILSGETTPGGGVVTCVRGGVTWALAGGRSGKREKVELRVETKMFSLTFGKGILPVP